jgi:hypothetical protein
MHRQLWDTQRNTHAQIRRLDPEKDSKQLEQFKDAMYG